MPRRDKESFSKTRNYYIPRVINSALPSNKDHLQIWRVLEWDLEQNKRSRLCVSFC